MQAIILAAGCGRRFGRGPTAVPKCLLKVGGRTLLQHQLEVLSYFDIRRVTVVVGHNADLVCTGLPPGCTTIVNQRYAETNSLTSLWLARQCVTGPFLLLNGDVLAHPEVYRQVLRAPGSALAYDSSSGKEPEHMRVAVSGGRVAAISKGLPLERVAGENLGILRFEADTCNLLFSAAELLIAAGGERSWAPAAVDSIASIARILALDVAGWPWTEIDFPHDLVRARRRVWPEICARPLTTRAPAPSRSVPLSL